ncbi:hypothetical protein LUZ63_017511 [Rhynchospora breviuscula]|uniref:chalcone synthase n=1 Tax=Rhynchospora breviuscula TaxID=2022672 RepID=A0A9Q0C2M9_9POAL|nr:hypothetical protein LUZ63_017511 [Rhynchospora breviuscula]
MTHFSPPLVYMWTIHSRLQLSHHLIRPMVHLVRPTAEPLLLVHRLVIPLLRCLLVHPQSDLLADEIIDSHQVLRLFGPRLRGSGSTDIAENNRGARILIVTSENILHAFRGPDEAHADFLVSQALFSDGAAAVIVGADPDFEVERPLFEIISARETLILNTMEELGMQLREVGNLIFLSPSIPKHISANIEGCLLEAFKPLGITDWNSIFWVSHPGGPAILNQVEAKLKLNKDKLRLSRKVLSEYGNLSSPTVLFILNELRKESVSEGKSTTGNGFEYGVLLGFGPGLSIETVVLRSIPI